MTWEEVDHAVSYLAQEGLIRTEGPRSVDAYIQVTNLGINFVQSEKDLREFMTDHPSRLNGPVTTNTVNIHGNADNSNIAGGSHNSQTLTHGVDATALAALVSQLRAIAQTVELPAEDAQDLDEEIDALERERGDRSRAQRIWRRIARIVTPALTSAAAAGSEQAVQAAITAGNQLFS